MRKKHLSNLARERAGVLAGAIFLLAITVLAAPLGATNLGDQKGFKKAAFEKLVFAPDLVMRHQAEIGLTEDQKQFLVAELQRTQADLVPLQFEIAEAGEALVRLLAQAPVDEASALAEAELVMRLEAEIKTLHLSLVIRIKNMLSGEQQAMLRAIRERRGS